MLDYVVSLFFSPSKISPPQHLHSASLSNFFFFSLNTPPHADSGRLADQVSLGWEALLRVEELRHGHAGPRRSGERDCQAITSKAASHAHFLMTFPQVQKIYSFFFARLISCATKHCHSCIRMKCKTVTCLKKSQFKETLSDSGAFFQVAE